jgi:hypothetical protein
VSRSMDVGRTGTGIMWNLLFGSQKTWFSLSIFSDVENKIQRM